MASERTSIKIDSFNPELKQDLANIAANMGVPLAPFLKMKLREVRDSFPAEMRRKKAKD